MGFHARLMQSIFVLAGMILLAALLRRLSVIKDEHGPVFASLVTDLTLPALIFSTLARHKLTEEQLWLALIMMFAETVCIFAAIGVSGLLRLSPAKRGAVVLASAFGSSAFLGYAVVKQVFYDQPGAMTDAVILSELGGGALIFTVGVYLAIHYGSADRARNVPIEALKRFIVSPVFLSLAGGITFSLLSIDTTRGLFVPIFRLLKTLGNANTVFVALAIGTMLRFHDLRSAIWIVAAVCVIKLVLQPAVAAIPGHLLRLDATAMNVLVLETAMPSATLSAVFAARYGCDGRLGALLVFATLLASTVSVAVVVALLG